MRFYFSKFFSTLLTFSAIFLLNACSLKTETIDRKFIPPMQMGKYQQLLPANSNEDNFLPDLYEPALASSSCDWLNTLPAGNIAAERFRLLGTWDLKKISTNDGLSAVQGGVDIAASPMYQYALLSQSIPDKNEFLALLDQEYAKATSFGDTVKLGLVKFLLSLGILDPYSLRNSIVQTKMDEAFPGAFPDENNHAVFPESIPGAMFKNGNPLLSSLSFSTNDNANDQQKKAAELQKVFSIYSKPVRLFSTNTWAGFTADMQFGISTAIRGFSSKNVEEQACSTVILHRAFAQLLSVMGYRKPPVELDAGTQNSGLPKFEEILTSPTDSTIATCSVAGSFVQKNYRVMLSRDDLSAADDKNPFLLSPKPYLSPLCSKDTVHAVKGPGERSDETANASDLLAFLDGVVNFSTAFNPGASWWRNPNNAVGYPMSPFESLDKIKSSGAILPSDAHALSLGLLGMAFSSLQARHLVFIDSTAKEVSTSNGAAGVRVSEVARGVGDAKVVVTKVQSASYLMEIAFKLSNSLWSMGEWKKFAEESLQDDLRAQKDRKKQLQIQDDYNNFIESMFGSEANLDKLTNASPASLRDQLKDLKLASSLLGIIFSRRTADGGISCFAEITTNPLTGEEVKRGECSASEEKQWKYAMRLAARSFHSPLFAEAGE